METSLKYPASMKKNNLNFVTDILLLFILLFLMEQRGTGNFIHEWLGIILFLAISVHVLQHLEWIKCAIIRFSSASTGIVRIKFILNILIFADLVTILFSGLMISRELLPWSSAQPENHYFWRAVHHVSADMLVIFTAIHLALNWDRILNHFNKAFQSGYKNLENAGEIQPAIPSPENKAGKTNNHVHRTGYLKMLFILVLFSSGISTGWYVLSNTGIARPATGQCRQEVQVSPARFIHARHRHLSGTDNPGHRGPASPARILPGMMQNIAMLFLFVFLIVMARAHFR
jgi:hypothetical protein